MYEQAIRLGQEPHSLLTISKVTYCLLSCINTLHLVNEKYRWIVRPVMNQNSEGNFGEKRSATGEKVLKFDVKKLIEVLELTEIKKEYVLAEAKLKLAKLNPSKYCAVQTCEYSTNLSKNPGIFFYILCTNSLIYLSRSI